MANVNDYTTGRILTDTKLALYSLKFVKIPFIGSLVGNELLKKIRKFEPKQIDMETVTRLISIHNPENHTLMNCLLLKVSQKDRTSFIADCALMFCIDTTRYVNWIGCQNYR